MTYAITRARYRELLAQGCAPCLGEKIAYGNAELEKLPPAKKGDAVHCPTCGSQHPLECGTINGKESDVALFYRCGDKSFLGAIGGHRI